jgi:hypothetical protein
MNLYLLMTAIFILMASLMAADAALTSFTLVPWFNGLRWLRVHLITLGAMTEALFGLLQFGYAFIPFFFYRLFLPHEPARLGGSWFSLVTVNLGGFFLWASIHSHFAPSYPRPRRYTTWIDTLRVPTSARQVALPGTEC